jgi:hypothetical protein
VILYLFVSLSLVFFVEDGIEVVPCWVDFVDDFEFVIDIIYILMLVIGVGVIPCIKIN